MKKIILFFVLGIFSAVALSTGVEGVEATGWSSPGNLGEGAFPRFALDSKQVLTLRFEQNGHELLTRLTEDGSWTAPIQVPAVSEHDFPATDPSGAAFVAQNKGGSLLVSLQTPDGSIARTEMVVEATPKVHTGILGFSIDAVGAKHLLFSRTADFEYGYQYPGSDVFYKRQIKGSWEKEIPVTKKMSISRTFQVPGISVTPGGKIFLCSYGEIYSLSGQGSFVKEQCPIHDFYVPVRIAAEENGDLHCVYQSYAEDGKFEQDSLMYVTRRGGNWSAPVKIGSQKGEHIPALFRTSKGELIVAWEDPEGNILVSRRKSER